ncbi:MAG: hypothetical protein ACLP2P_03700 [Desulfobaccales bacterium]
MFRKEFPMIYEILFDQILDRDCENAYGRYSESILPTSPEIKRFWLRIEKALQGLDPCSQKVLKKKVCPYLTKKHAGRGWHQLFDVLNEARAYNYLISLGCSDVHVIPESRKNDEQSPDLEGVLSSDKVLCEVKTINISDEEAIVRASDKPIAGNTQNQLVKGFFDKLRSCITKAGEQLKAYDSSNNARLIVYIFILFDEYPFCEYKERYFQQIDQYLSENIVTGIELVIHNLETAFHKPITMQFATVVND